MQRSASRELWYALAAIVFITLAYIIVSIVFRGIPAAFSFYGHTMGILGFLLMLMTETLYTLRKRTRSARWGRMASWLEFHIFTGLVGPYIVLLHSAWKFNGVAGVVMLFTVLIVVSGFIGRYIYTSIPRGPGGEEVSIDQMEALIQRIEDGVMRMEKSEAASTVVVAGRTKALKELRARRDRLKKEMRRVNTARRLFSLWHTIHIPLGLSLFALAFFHIGAAIYYASLLH